MSDKRWLVYWAPEIKKIDDFSRKMGTNDNYVIPTEDPKSLVRFVEISNTRVVIAEFDFSTRTQYQFQALKWVRKRLNKAVRLIVIVAAQPTLTVSIVLQKVADVVIVCPYSIEKLECVIDSLSALPGIAHSQ